MDSNTKSKTNTNPKSEENDFLNLLKTLSGPLGMGVGGFFLGKLLSANQAQQAANAKLESDLRKANDNIETLTKQVKELKENMAKVLEISLWLKAAQTGEHSPPAVATPAYQKSYQLH